MNHRIKFQHWSTQPICSNPNKSLGFMAEHDIADVQDFEGTLHSQRTSTIMGINKIQSITPNRPRDKIKRGTSTNMLSVSRHDLPEVHQTLRVSHNQFPWLTVLTMFVSSLCSTESTRPIMANERLRLCLHLRNKYHK